MASIRLTQFAGLMPDLSAKLKNKVNAQIAHNCLLYDGKLRAMPAYFKYQTLTNVPRSLYRASTFPFPSPGGVLPDFDFSYSFYFDGPPFPVGLYGIAITQTGDTILANKFGLPGMTGNVLPAGVGSPVILGINSTNIVPNNQSVRPTVISYAITFVRRLATNKVEESPPVWVATVGNNGSQLYYDGDLVQLNFDIATPDAGQTGIRLYRTITALETGEQLVNTFDTDWYLVAEIPTNQMLPIGGGLNVVYGDIATSQSIPGDLLLSELFFPPGSLLTSAGLTESGWLWVSTYNTLAFSERFLPHAWPPSGFLKFPNVTDIRGIATYYDMVFLGTSAEPFRATVSVSDDDTVQANAYPYPEKQPCIPFTMVRAPFGALYTSPNGIVSLEESRMQMISRELLNGGNVLYTWCEDDVQKQFKFSDIGYATWFNGFYIGYDIRGKIFVYQPPEDLNDFHAFQQLVTMDAPIEQLPVAWVQGGYGLQIAFENNLYYWPIPGWVRSTDTPQKLPYKWKSKKFVMPGRTNFGAAKVVWECDGTVCFKLYSDCILVYSRTVTDCQPFRLPSEYIGVEFEIELLGTGTVSEVHVASSMKELTEVETI